MTPSHLLSSAQNARRRPSAGALLSVGASLLWLPMAGLLAVAVQRIANGMGLQALWWPALGILLIGVVRAWCEAKGMRLSYVLARDNLTQLRLQVVKALAQASPMARERTASGAAASAVAEQAEAIVPWLSRYQPAMWRVMLVPPCIVVCVATQSWMAAVILLFAAPMIPLFMAIVGWRARAASEEQMLQVSSMNAFLLDRLRGLSTLRALDAVPATAARLSASAQSLRERTMKVLRIAFLSSAVLELFSALGVAMVAVYVGFHLLGNLSFGAWGSTLTLGQALWILLLAPAFFDPLRDLSAVWHDKASGQAALAGLEQLSAPEPVLHGVFSPPVAAAQPGACSLRVAGLAVGWPGSEREAPLLDFELRAGEHIALWAPSGSGKSVLLSQLAGLVPAEPGQIWMDDKLLTPQTAASLRARIGWMGQSPHVFAASVHDNVALGRPDVSAAAVQAAMAAAALGESTRVRPSTSLGEGGQGLSGGESVRLALARLAVQADTGLWLIDEPTAHLDLATAHEVTEALLTLSAGRSLLVATHDPVLAARMDRVIYLDSAPAPQRTLA